MDIYNKLEYNQITQIVQSYCKTYIAKKLCSNLEPSFSFENVNNLLSETMEAVTLLYKKGNPPFAELAEMEIYIKALSSNQILSAKALLDLAHLLKMSRELKEYFKNDVLENTTKSIMQNTEITLEEHSSLLEKYFAQLYSNPAIEKEILEKILDETTINDNASPKLFALRKSRKSAEQNIKDKLNSFIHSSKHAKYLMEPVITIRNNRYVIPVKQEYRSMIQGFVHDISASGSTVFIEPTNVFEINNQIASLKIEEEIEIERILQILSSLFYDIIPELEENLSIIGILDLIFAKAQYSKNINGIMPILNSEKKIILKKARHPSIDPSIVVPIDIPLDENYTSLIITGPNTGGKTVALKTVGLLLLMAYSGILIPCSEESSICVLDNIFVDIGDEQNIQESLSTFSSHILNIVQISKKVTANSLVLLDELGSGTDPIEGASLAIAVLEYFSKVGALTMCTTHYQELKEFALVTDGFENASFEFDIENLKPTYHLLIGIPGKSNAFEISKRLGLPNSIIDRAKLFINDEHVSIEELLKSIYDDKITIENKKAEIEDNLKQIENIKKSLEQDQSYLIEKQQQMIDDAKIEARDILLSAKEEATEIIRQLNDEHLNTKHANQLRNKLNDKIKNISDITASNNSSNSFNYLTAENVHEGLKVFVPRLQSEGIVLSKYPNKNEEALVQIGLAKMNLKLSELSLISESQVKNNSNNFNTGKVTTVQDSKTKFISPEINVIGQNVDDAIYVIDKYLDNCAMSGMSPVRIVHGKGTGKLREGIHSYLKKNPHVKSFRLGTFGEGEMGVTIVELK